MMVWRCVPDGVFVRVGLGPGAFRRSKASLPRIPSRKSTLHNLVRFGGDAQNHVLADVVSTKNTNAHTNDSIMMRFSFLFGTPFETDKEAQSLGILSR